MRPPEDKKFEPIKEGTHLAVCISVIDLGEQPDDFNEGATKRVVRLEWELPKLKRDDGKNQVIGNEYTYSYNEKANLFKDLTSWLGSEFNPKLDMLRLGLLGRGCLLSIIHKTSGKGNVYAKVSSVSQLIDGISAPEPTYKLTSFDMENFDNAKYQLLATFIKDKISNSKEFKVIMMGNRVETPGEEIQDEPDGDIPF